MSKGTRYEEEPKLNMKKVFAVIIAIIVIIMCVIMLKGILSKDKSKDKKIATNKEYFAAYQDNKWGIIDESGNIVIDPSYAEMIVVPDSKKDIFLCTYDVDYTNNTYKTKAFNSKNEDIFTDYENIEAISNLDKDNNLWYENNLLKVEKNGLYGVIDFSGKEILPCEYENIESLQGIEKTLKVTKNGKVGISDENGNILVSPEYMNISGIGKDRSGGFIVQSAETNKYGVVDTSNKVILEAKYDSVKDVYQTGGYYVVTEGQNQEVVKSNGEVVLNAKTDNIISILKNPENGVIFERQGNYGIMNLSGNIVIKNEYNNLKEGKSGIIIAEKDKKYGIIDLQGNQLLDFKYNNLYYNEKADLYVAEDDQYENEILDTNYQVKQTGYLIELNTDNGYMELNQNNSYNYYNFKFEELKPADIFKTSTLFVSKKEGKYGFVDKDGNVVVDYTYDDATSQNKYGYAGVKKDGKWGVIDNTGKVIQEPTYNLDDYLKIDFIGRWHLGKDINMNYYDKQ